MKSYYHARLDDEGYVTGVFSSYSTSEPGCVRIARDAPLHLGVKKLKYVGGGEFEETDETWLPQPSVAFARAAQYPPLGDQLDAIWKAIAPLIEHPEAEAMLAKIRSVKASNPKPTNSQ